MSSKKFIIRLTFCAVLLGWVTFTTHTGAQSSFIFVAPQGESSIEPFRKDLTQAEVAQSGAEGNSNKAHAPEPSTLALFFGGVIGMFVQFMRMSFRAAKRTIDFTLSLIAIIISASLMAVIAVLVKLTSKGPIIYRQERVGRGGKHFYMLKFRSMRVDAESGTGAVWAKQNDPRVTPIGGFLRKSHLDELPQFINVLKGEMSIVGPRPERPEMVKQLKQSITDYEKRLDVLPGITGLAQVLNKYDETLADVRKKVKYDLFYIRKMCWLVEMRIMALTCLVMVRGKVAAR